TAGPPSQRVLASFGRSHLGRCGESLCSGTLPPFLLLSSTDLSVHTDVLLTTPPHNSLSSSQVPLYFIYVITEAQLTGRYNADKQLW
uniref:Uncharacterized protein n=1 Tax=Strix occidentalis caurina TaxID=311401 RepID=A0A8D0FKS5_STROC